MTPALTKLRYTADSEGRGWMPSGPVQAPACGLPSTASTAASPRPRSRSRPASDAGSAAGGRSDCPSPRGLPLRIEPAKRATSEAHPPIPGDLLDRAAIADDRQDPLGSLL